MPELPEVEIIRRGLEEELIGSTIAEVSIDWEKSMPVMRKVLIERVINQKIKAFRRRGKVMIIDLNNGYSLLIHLKMTGQLVLDRQKGVSRRVSGGHPTGSFHKKLPDNSTRVVITFIDGAKLFFNDQRKFGWVKLVKSSAVEKEKFLAAMGPEPLEKDFKVTALASRLRRTRRPIKAALLDQRVVAGVGNIYADEALHLARIHPLIPSNSLNVVEIKRLHQAIQSVLIKSIDHGGTSFTNYVDSRGLKGDYLHSARVFKREGQPCRECGTIIEKIRVAGRGTHVCPDCQRLKA